METASASADVEVGVPAHVEEVPAVVAAPAEEAAVPTVAVLEAAATPADPASAAAAEPPEFHETAVDYSGEPLADRLSSKDLGRRCSGYAEVKEKLSIGEDEEAFCTFGKHLRTCIDETLPKGQDAAYNALVAYLDKYTICESGPQEPDLLQLVRGLIDNKAIDKPKLQQLISSVILLCAEICTCPAVLKEMLDCLMELDNAKKKLQGFFKKQVAFVIRVVHQMVAGFGVAKMSPKGFLPTVFKYIPDSDKGIRDACYAVLVELSDWIDISEMTKPLEANQQKELTKRLSAQVNEEQGQRPTKTPTRFYRGEKSGENPANASASQATPQSIDAYDLVSAVDVTKKLSKGWCIKQVHAMEKWKEKQQHLQQFSSILESAQRIVPSDMYSEMTESFKRLFNESNIPVVQEAAKCVGLLARGLRRDYEKPAKILLHAALARIHDKSVWKQNIFIERVEQLLYSVSFDFLLEELKPSVASKSLFVKKEAMGLLFRALDLPQVKQNCPEAAEVFFSDLAAAVVANVDDADNLVRQEAAKFIALLAYRNSSSPDVQSIALDKVPSQRRGAVEDEWKKISKGEPCPWSSKKGQATQNDTRPKQTVSSSSSRRPITPRQCSPRTAAPSNRPVSPQRQGAPASPMRQRIASPRRAPSVAHELADPSDAVDDEERSLVQKMAEEIRVLKTQVQELQGKAPESRCGSPSRVRSSTPPKQRPTAVPRDITPPRNRDAGLTPRDGSPLQRRFGRPSGAEGSKIRPQSSDTKRPTQAQLRRSESDRCLGRNVQDSCSTVLDIQIEKPRLPKIERQERERFRYWGPDPIPAEHLRALQASWQTCVDEQIWNKMFSNKMESQLAALDCWKRYVQTQTDNAEVLLEVLDLLFKWLTWLLFNTNTQIWKLAIDLMFRLLESVEASGAQLTDKEAFILFPNLLEKSGHNIGSIRESMCVLVTRALSVYQPSKALQFFVHALASKNKRSTACTVRILGDSLDKCVVALLMKRASKELAALLKTLEDKDVEVRKSAVQTVANLSMHMPSDAFERILAMVPPAANGQIRSAAQRIPPMQRIHSAALPGDDGEPGSPNASFDRAPTSTLMPSAAPSRVGVVQGSTFSPGKAMPGPLISASASAAAKAAPRMASPRSRAVGSSSLVGMLVPATTGAIDLAAASSPPSTRPQMISPAISPILLPDSGVKANPQVLATIRQLPDCSLECFQSGCNFLKDSMKRLNDAEVPPLAEVLATAMRMYFGHEGFVERCWPLANVIDEFCASRDLVRLMDKDLSARVLRELLRNLNYNTWTKHPELGESLLKKLNLCCVMLLQNLSKQQSFSLLLSLGTDESEVVGSVLASKCLKKLSKNFTASKNLDHDAVSIAFQEVHVWLRRVGPRLKEIGDSHAGTIDTVMEGAKALIEAARAANPAYAKAFVQKLEAEGDVSSEFFRWWLQSQDENRLPNNGTAPESSRVVEAPRPLKRRVSSPGAIRA